YNNNGIFTTSSASSSTGFVGIDDEGTFYDNLLSPVTVVSGSDSGGTLMQEHVYANGKYYQHSQGNSSVGQPGDWESMIPIWGSGRAAIDHFQNGNYWWGTAHALLAISDVFLVKSIATGIVKGGIKLAGSSSWSAVRKYYLKTGFAKPNQPLHHWLIHQKGPLGRHVPNAIKNQMWNLKSFNSASMHMRAGHGRSFLGQKGYGILGQLWYGTPAWPKYVVGSYGGRALDLGDEDYE
ncbi:MAG TPA: hypothetical protein VFR70_10525, partial [Flavobacterium sp.]|nr:hypothetical protein [Flavobacterium sp.]